MSDSESDIELKSALPKKQVKLQRSPSDVINNYLKKTTTRTMIKEALTELKSKKGVSLHAIKKYLMERYQVNTEKLNYFIKKTLKAGVEDGTFIQLKGIGASGSFKLAIVKEKVKKPKKKKEVEEPKTETEKGAKIIKKKKVEVLIIEKPARNKPKTKTKEKTEKSKPSTKKDEVKVTKTKKKETKLEEKPKKPKSKMAKAIQTPAKKRTLIMRRKSSGTIIKPPKMKPKNK